MPEPLNRNDWATIIFALTFLESNLDDETEEILQQSVLFTDLEAPTANQVGALANRLLPHIKVDNDEDQSTTDAG